MSQSTPAPNRPALTPGLMPWLLLAAVVWSYQPGLNGPFVFDDYPGVVRNAELRRLWPLDRFLHGSRPLTDLTFALNYRMTAEPTAVVFRVTNVLIHYGAALALYGLIRRTYRRACPGQEQRATVVAMTAALLWVIHPLATQAVTYIVQRAESLAGLFLFLTLYAGVRAAEATGRASTWRWSAAAAGACALGMASKQVVLAAPLLMLLLDRTFFAGSFAAALRHRWGMYLGLAATWIVLLKTVGFGQTITYTGPHAVIGYAVRDLDWWTYFLNQPNSIAQYLRLSLWPASLCLDYGWDARRQISEYLPNFIAVLILGLLTLGAIARRSWLGVAGAFFFAVLAPTSSFVPIRDICVEHRMYAPLAAVVVAVVLSVDALLKRRDVLPRWAVVLVVGLVVAGLMLRTRARNSDYRDEVGLWRATAAAAPGNSRALVNLGQAYDRADNPAAALRCARMALLLDPGNGNAYFNAGVSLHKLGRHAQAIHMMSLAALVYPDAHQVMARSWDALGQRDRALWHYQQRVRGQPHVADGYNDLAAAFQARDQTTQAIAALEKVIELDPSSALGHYNLGVILLHQGRRPEGLRLLARAVELDGNLASGFWRLGISLLDDKRPAEALPLLLRAVELEPDHADYNASLADALSRLGQYAPAIHHYDLAIAAEPDRLVFYLNRGLAYGKSGRFEDAERDFRFVLDREPDNADALGHLATLERLRRSGGGGEK